MFRNLCLPLLVLSGFLPSHGHPLGDLASSMGPGEWKELATSGLTRELIETDVNGEGSNPNTDYSDNLVWDAAGQQLLFVGSGSYKAYKFLRYRAEGNLWSGDPNLPACMYNQAEKCPSHGFDNATLDPDSGRFDFFVQGTLHSFGLAGEKWTSRKTPSEVATEIGGAMEYFQELKALVLLVNGKVALFDKASGKAESLAGNLKMGGYHNVAVRSAARKEVYFGGGNDSRDFYRLDGKKTILKLPDAPGVMHVAFSTLVADPAGESILFLSEGDSLHAFSPSANAWSYAGRAPFGDHALAASLDGLGVALFLVPSQRKVYLYKHSQGPTALGRPTGRDAHMTAAPIRADAGGRSFPTKRGRVLSDGRRLKRSHQ